MVEARPEVRAMTLYTPGMPLSEARSNTGRQQMVKLASNESLWGPSPRAMEAARMALESVNYYPLVQELELLAEIGRHNGLQSQEVVLGNGADEILRLVAEAYLQPGDEVIYPTPSFSAYAHCALLGGATGIPVPLQDNGAIDLAGILARVTKKTRLIYVCTPNNPTGVPFSVDDWDRYIRQVPDHVLTVVDSAYYEFCRGPQPDYAAAIRAGRPLVWARTFSKLYALAALRVGWGGAPEFVIQNLLRVRDPFSVNTIAAAAALASIRDQVYFSRVREETFKARDFLSQRLSQAGAFVYSSEANFVTLAVPEPVEAVEMRLRERGFVVRSTASFGLPGKIRVTVAPMPIMQEFVAAFDTL